MEGQIIEELDLYSDFKSDLDEMIKRDFFDSDNANTWENNWFCINEPCDEECRICIVLVLLVYELEQDKVTSRMIGELNYYYNEAFVQKNLEDLFEEPEAKEKCFADLKWCYDTAKQKGLID